MAARKFYPARDITEDDRRLFCYNPETGEIFRTKNRGGVTTDTRAGTITASGYRKITFMGRLYREHRLAWWLHYGRWPDGDIDHINGVRDDNRMANLREATRSQNMGNTGKRRTNKTGAKGVVQVGNRYGAYITVDGATQYLGLSKTVEEASLRYETAARELFGEFAKS